MITLPLPPSLNHAYITRYGTGKRIMTSECRKFKMDADLLIRAALKGSKPFDKLSLIQYRFYFPDDRRRDVPDNFSKVLRDCLKGTLVKDDCWQCITKEDFGPHGIDCKNPRVEIEWVE